MEVKHGEEKAEAKEAVEVDRGCGEHADQVSRRAKFVAQDAFEKSCWVALKKARLSRHQKQKFAEQFTPAARGERVGRKVVDP